MFKITDGKGFHIKFANGFMMSVQWGSGNYCDNYNADVSDQRNVGERGSRDAEIAVFDNKNEWYPINGNDVTGYLSPDDVLALMVEIAAIKTCSECGDKLVGHEDETSTVCRWCNVAGRDITEGEYLDSLEE